MAFSFNTFSPSSILLSDSPLPLLPSTVTYSPTIIPSLLNPVSDITLSPIVGRTIGTTYVGPVGATVLVPGPFTLPRELDLNKDSRVRNDVSKYFRYKTLDQWLYEDMSDLLNYFTVSQSKVYLIKNLSELKSTPVSQMNPDDVEKIISWIEHYMLTEDTMKRILSQFIKETRANWYDLHKNEYFVKEIIHKKLKKFIRNTINDALMK